MCKSVEWFPKLFWKGKLALTAEASLWGGGLLSNTKEEVRYHMELYTQLDLSPGPNQVNE